MMVPFTREGTSEKESAFFFHVVIGTHVIGEFKSVSGFGRRVNTIDLLEGGRNHGPRVRWAPHGGHSPCTLTSGSTSSGSMFEWIASVDAGRDFRRVVTIVQLTRARVPLRFFLLFGAFPESWSGPNLDADASGNDEESVVLKYDSMTVVTDPAVLVMDVIPTARPTEFDTAPEGSNLKESDGTFRFMTKPDLLEYGKDEAVLKLQKNIRFAGGKVQKLNHITIEQGGEGSTELNNQDGLTNGKAARLVRKFGAAKRKPKDPRGLYTQKGIHSSPVKHKALNFKFKRKTDWKLVTLSNNYFVPHTPIAPVVLSNGVFLPSTWSSNDE